MHDGLQQLTNICRIAWQRRWLGLTIAWVVACLGWLVTIFLPNTYTSSARIFVDTESLIEPLLKGITIQTDVDQQIQTFQRTLLSRPNLRKVIKEVGLDLDATTLRDEEVLIDSLIREVTVQSEGRNMFTVQAQRTDPGEAKDIVQSLLDLFVEENLGASQKDIDTARRFIDDQIAVHESQLEQAEQRLADFKKRNVGFLPGEGNLLGQLQSFQASVPGLFSELQSAVAQRDRLREELDRVPERIEQETPVAVAPSNNLTPDQVELERLLNQLSQLTTRYTDEHPSVVNTRQEIANLRARTRGRGSSSGSLIAKSLIPNPVFEQLTLQLVNKEAEIARLQSQLSREQLELNRLEEQAQTVPVVEAELARLNRDYQVIKNNYEQLLERRESARISKELDDSTDKIDFRIVDPPSIPVNPSGPPRFLMIPIILFAAIGGGLLLAVMTGNIVPVISTVGDLQRRFGLPVLGSISRIGTDNHGVAVGAVVAFAGLSATLIAVCASLLVANQLGILTGLSDLIHGVMGR